VSKGIDVSVVLSRGCWYDGYLRIGRGVFVGATEMICRCWRGRSPLSLEEGISVGAWLHLADQFSTPGM